jgi:predicted MFS family arabinose efflux permease
MDEAPEANELDRAWQRSGFRIQNGYWWYYTAIGAYLPFAALYFRELGFSGARIGILAALFSLGTAFVGPLAGAIADARGIHRTLVRAALLGSVIAALLLSRITSFWPFFLLTAIFATCMAPIPSLLDSYSVTAGNRLGISFGRMRVWGSAGFMVAVLAVGQWTGDVVDRRFYYAAAFGLGIALLALFALPAMGHHKRESLFGGFGDIVQNRPLVLLMLVALLTACGTTISFNFLGIHLEALDGSARLVGPAFAIGAASELPVIALAGLAMRKVPPPWLLIAAILVYGARFAIYGWTENTDLLLVLQALHGLSYGLFLTTSITLAYRLAGPALAATAQALLTAMSFGFGSIAGSLIGGALLDRVGTDSLFQIAAGLMLVAAAVLIIGNRFAPLAPGASTA